MLSPPISDRLNNLICPSFLKKTLCIQGIFVSHDVDRPSQFPKLSLIRLILSTGKDVLINKNFSSIFKAPIIYFFQSSKLFSFDRNNTFEWLMDQSEELGIKSAFYFIMGRTDKRYDAFYDPSDKMIRNLMRKIHKRGHEIGLHPSYKTYNKPELIVQEANTLKKVCEEEQIYQEQWGGRMHYLRWQSPTTLHGWENAGMTYESTLSYADHAGFRCGTCREYPAFDPLQNRILNLNIRPLIAMDCSVVSKPYMGLGHTDEALNKFLELKRQCKKVNGNFTLLWHNSFFEHKKDFEIYKAILRN